MPYTYSRPESTHPFSKDKTSQYSILGLFFFFIFCCYKHSDLCAGRTETTYRAIQTMTRNKNTHTDAAYNDFTINNNILPRIDLP